VYIYVAQHQQTTYHMLSVLVMREGKCLVVIMKTRWWQSSVSEWIWQRLFHAAAAVQMSERPP